MPPSGEDLIGHVPGWGRSQPAGRTRDGQEDKNGELHSLVSTSEESQLRTVSPQDHFPVIQVFQGIFVYELISLSPHDTLENTRVNLDD